MTPTGDDARLVESALAGDAPAFGRLIDAHRPEAVRLAGRLLGDPWEAEDVVQEATLQAFLGLRRLRDPTRFVAWLLGIVVNLCRMHLRSRRDEHPLAGWDGGRVVQDRTWAGAQPPPEEVFEIRELQRAILAAIAGLPTEQREVVRLHYIDGLTLEDIRVLMGAPVGTVKARLHRARARLRRALAIEGLGIPAGRAPGKKEEEASMVEVTVYDVMVRAPKVRDVKRLAGPQEEGPERTRVVLLKEKAGERVLPIWIGVAEGDALAMQLAAIATPRPLTFDLMARLLELTGARVESVAINRVHESTYYATLRVGTGPRTSEVDARPSDALNLAVRVGAPVFIAPEVLEQARAYLSAPQDVPTVLEAAHRTLAGGRIDAEEMVWRSFRSLPQGSLLAHFRPPGR
jgi:RNA polymerase sigma factor (sigma-70 family)